MKTKIRKYRRNKLGGVEVYEEVVDIPEEKDFTKEVLKRIAKKQSINISDLEPVEVEPTEEEPVK